MLSRTKERPRGVKMLTRSFIADSLYHPSYGYFSRAVNIFSPKTPYVFSTFPGAEDFLIEWTKNFNEAKEAAGKQDLRYGTQVWHTPTELFRPYYGEAFARYIVAHHDPVERLNIYEMGAGNGTLMDNILSYLKLHHLDLYRRTTYNIIEITGQLAEKQKKVLAKHPNRIKISNKSIFDWNTPVNEPCFFIAAEVFDNFPHDVLRYDNITDTPYQGYVMVDGDGDFHEFFSPDLDPLAKKFLEYRSKDLTLVSNAGRTHPLNQPRWWRRTKSLMPVLGKPLSDPEYIPTKYVEFLHILQKYFPNHKLIATDFHSLKDTIPGYNAPVTQTLMDGKMIPVSTYMTHQGFFDIMFPTDFRLAAHLYKQVTGKNAETKSHREFLEPYTSLQDTEVRSGENPMLDFYQNASFLISNSPGSARLS
ncbi:hypothetical protein CANCADRAFT_24498 [Tortispora caseinolytica NRRL Y-17796]|uniref:Protein arginine methyltransferase NDUFAF7 n=1 Tax=Tortispora caseinolytica NRRL Y-17796 TaxID=767744 RepID=A0A1E4TEA7_9ASCO|nr:hypothetical protein CANCADRAFT_24498 [Tortispora caseinolytica NRRL Y-17796]